MFSKRSITLKAVTILALTLASQNNAQTIEIGDQTTSVEESGMTLQEAQDAMDPIRLIEAYLVDKEGPRNARGGWGTRDSNTYRVGEQIDAVIYLANVGKHNPGQPDNPQEMELSINIRDKAGNIVYQAPLAHTFRGVRRLDDPLQDDYFSDRFTVSARVPDVGEYDVGFVFLDRTRPAEKQVALEVKLDVVIVAAEATETLTDLTQMMMNDGMDQSYLLRRCAAYFRSQIEFYGPDRFSEEDFAIIDSKVRYFIYGDAVINADAQGITMDAALDDTFAAMKDISSAYLDRMARNYTAGQHPWAEDTMLRRDEAACTVIFDGRSTQ
ncbi:hypothetical protein [Yoonia sp. SDW83-1]|uniref:hypothetical protein n=1 Tax=Yoonia sp. SDW83-1 TaxID=3366945 RepID=UPI00398C545E